LRLANHNYAAGGAYFVTLCAHKGQVLFGEICSDAIKLNSWGESIAHEWTSTSKIRPGILLDAYVIMPNHFHGIIILPAHDQNSVGARSSAPSEPGVPIDFVGARSSAPQTRASRSLGALIGAFKGASTRAIRKITGNPNELVWQRNYYEHIIRSENDLLKIREYIELNPARWAEDAENPEIRNKQPA